MSTPDLRTNSYILATVLHKNSYNKVYYRLYHDVVTWDVDRDVPTAYC